MSDSGAFIVVWQSFGEDGDGYGVFGRCFAEDGTPSYDSFQVNTYTSGDQLGAEVALDADGGFVVVWVSYSPTDEGGQDGSASGVFGQRFSSDGTRQGREFQVNTYTRGSQGEVFASPELDVAGWSDGRFVAVWTSADQDGDRPGIFGQSFFVDGDLGPVCGDASNSDLLVTATDALALLHAAVGLRTCERCLCDADDSGAIVASDALSVLSAAVGLGTTLMCPACDE
jgi:hypothetical protein